jgi:MFS family permease
LSPSPDVQPTAAKPAPRRAILATVIGNALEFYDFTTYAVFAVPIGQAYFPGRTPFEKLMLSLVGFGVGFVTRPVGALVIGRLGDKAGRRPAMVLSFALMGLAMLAMALTPPLADIGLIAPAIVVAARLVQGFAVGGEFGPATAYLLEAAPESRRGFFGSWQSASQGLAILAAGLVGVTLSALLSPADLTNWGWRIAFLLGAATLPVGLMARSRLPETLHAPETPRPLAPSAAPVRAGGYGLVLVLGFVTVMSSTTLTYVLTYMTTFATASLRLQTGVAFMASVIGGLCGLVFCPLSGALSDVIGRKPLMIWPRVLLLLAAYPAFQLIFQLRSAAALLGGTAVLAALGAASAAPALVWLTETLPRHARSTSLAAIYTAAVTLFGSTTQIVVAWLIHATGDVRSPSYYVLAMSLLGVIAAWMAAETGPVARARTAG